MINIITSTSPCHSVRKHHDQYLNILIDTLTPPCHSVRKHHDQYLNIMIDTLTPAGHPSNPNFKQQPAGTAQYHIIYPYINFNMTLTQTVIPFT